MKNSDKEKPGSHKHDNLTNYERKSSKFLVLNSLYKFFTLFI